jgi:hypothetical protein
VCKLLKKDLSLQFAVSVGEVELTPTVLDSYETVMAASMGIDPAFVTATTVPPSESRRRRLLQSDLKIYFIIRVPAENITTVFANLTISNATNITESIDNVTSTFDIAQIMEAVVTQIKSETFQETLVQAIAEAQLVAVVVDTSTVIAEVIKELPPNCPPGKFCVGSDIFNCSGPCQRGSYQTKACTAAVDQVCTTCPPNHFCLGGLHKQICSTCQAGKSVLRPRAARFYI